MNILKSITFSAMASAVIFSLSACSSIKMEDNQAGAPIEARGGAGGANTRPTGTGTGTAGAGGQPSIDQSRLGGGGQALTPQQKALLDKRSIYFDYDSFVVRQQDQATVEAHARDLINAKKKVLIQGHTDERGGSEYNIALGQKRAEAVRQALAALGVPDTQMEAVSLGKEKPKTVGSSEEAYAENRRADLVY